MKLQNLSRAKNTVNKTKQETTDWERIFNNPISDRRIISKIYKELKKLIPNNANQPINKWGTEVSREFSTEES